MTYTIDTNSIICYIQVSLPCYGMVMHMEYLTIRKNVFPDSNARSLWPVNVLAK